MKQRTRIGGTPIQPEDPRSRVDWQALWLKDPIFSGIRHRKLIHPDRNSENNGDIQNIHTLFRRELTLDDRPIRRARLYITADDCYKLYLNGEFVGTGPAPAEELGGGEHVIVVTKAEARADATPDTQ